jgi:hypothetical protein
MYAIYRHSSSGKQPRYIYVQDAHIFGRNVGMIPRLLRSHPTTEMTEPLFWHVDLVAELPSLYGPDAHSVIDLMPNNSSELALYELLDAWVGWTPAMFRLRGLIVDGDKSELRAGTFTPHNDNLHKTIYSFVYFDGTVRQGTLHVSGHLREPVRPTPLCFGQRRFVTLSRAFACLPQRFWVIPNIAGVVRHSRASLSTPFSAVQIDQCRIIDRLWSVVRCLSPHTL